MTAPDPLETAYREMVAQTMKPCRELSLGQREMNRAAYQERLRLTEEERTAARLRREQLADLFGDDGSEVMAS